MSFKITSVILLGLLASLFLLYQLRLIGNPNQLLGPSSASVISPSPTPAFYQLTIPYLRQRTYQSKLSGLDKVSSSGLYSSFLTSYTSDGLKINGLITEPSGEMPTGGWPAIVFIHGYIPPNQYQTQTRYIDYVDYLARNDFVVFKIDLRGHGASEGTPSGAYYSSDYVIDALNAYAALQTTEFVNPKRIGIWGHSMAGNVTLRAMAAKPDIPAIVIWAGAAYTYTDLRQFGIQDNSYQPLPSDSKRQNDRQLLRQLYGDPTTDSAFWKQVAATNYLTDLKGAIQLNHAVDDPVVNIGYSRNLNNLLNATSIPHQLNEYPTGGHNINGPSFVVAMQNTVSFFKKYLAVD